mgnify:CR=1 FL=1
MAASPSGDMTVSEPSPPVAAHVRKARGRAEAPVASDAAAVVSSIVPPHKVGKELMYDRYAEAYDAHMAYHDCDTELLPCLVDIVERAVGVDMPSPAGGGTKEGRNTTEHRRTFAVIDVGCGTGRLPLLLSRKLPIRRVLGIDRSQGMLYQCRRRFVGASFVEEVTANELDHGESSTSGAAEDPNALAAPASTVLAAVRGWLVNGEVGDACPAAVEPAAVEGNCTSAAATPSFSLLRASMEQLASQADVMTLPPPAKGTTGSTILSDFDVNNHEEEELTLVTCGWSLSAVMNAAWGGTRWHSQVSSLLQHLEALAGETRRRHRRPPSPETLAPESGDAPAAVAGLFGHKQPPAGMVIIVETLGNMRELPSRGSSLHTFLKEKGYHMRPAAGGPPIRTDYKFPDLTVGHRCVQFFFGKDMADKYRAAGAATLMECTGVWWKLVR